MVLSHFCYILFSLRLPVLNVSRRAELVPRQLNLGS